MDLLTTKGSGVVAKNEIDSMKGEFQKQMKAEKEALEKLKREPAEALDAQTKETKRLRDEANEAPEALKKLKAGEIVSGTVPDGAMKATGLAKMRAEDRRRENLDVAHKCLVWVGEHLAPAEPKKEIWAALKKKLGPKEIPTTMHTADYNGRPSPVFILDFPGWAEREAGTPIINAMGGRWGARVLFGSATNGPNKYLVVAARDVGAVIVAGKTRLAPRSGLRSISTSRRGSTPWTARRWCAAWRRTLSSS